MFFFLIIGISPLDPDVMLLLQETVTLKVAADADEVGHVLALPDYELIALTIQLYSVTINISPIIHF